MNTPFRGGCCDPVQYPPILPTLTANVSFGYTQDSRTGEWHLHSTPSARTVMRVAGMIFTAPPQLFITEVRYDAAV